jgi:hydroxyacylglutathione hydrolase
MLATRTLRELAFEDALQLVDEGAAFIDLRKPTAYLEVHIPGSLCLVYEFGPGMASRARDCLPLDMAMVLMDHGPDADYVHAAAGLRGRGFTVLGKVTDALNRWADARGIPASTEVIRSTVEGTGTVLDVGDVGAPAVQDATHIPIDRLWLRVEELGKPERVAVVGGYGVRAALAVGILERAGLNQVLFYTDRG